VSDTPEPPGPPDNVTPITKKARAGRGGRRKEPEVRKVLVPTLPQADVSLETLKANADTPGKRAWAAFAMRKRMIPYSEIAEYLDYESAAHAKGAVCAILAATVSPEDTETLRHTIVAGLEDQLRRSITMASANSFVDAEGTHYPNLDRLAWHAEARRDYEVLARISGAQAAAQVQVTADALEIERVVRAIEAAQGREIIEADVVELGVLD
jgi:hypothetical protein